MTWWIWGIIGILLLILEFASSADFYFFFLGLAALIVALIQGICDSLGYELILNAQLLLFSAFAVFFMFFVRKRCVKKFFSNDGVKSELLDEEVLILEDIPVGETGPAETRGTSWIVRNKSEQVLEKGSKHLVSARDGIILIVEK